MIFFVNSIKINNRSVSLSISILSYIKKTKLDFLGKTNIYLRITVDGRRAEFSIHRKIEPSRWNSDTGLAKGSSKEIQELNRYIASIKSKLFSLHQLFIDRGEMVTAIKLRDRYLGKDEEWTYYIRLDIKLRDLELQELTLNHEKKKQKLQSII
ncbi:Arm DNA-binding domain-containing protein [Thalassobellus citreus]|uniref:Arm DNA-binding domain-containing protein n=1 Tax=Thalassobellus citreus TaxID=3367752 RepID=UPI0037A3FF0A